MHADTSHTALSLVHALTAILRRDADGTDPLERIIAAQMEGLRDTLTKAGARAQRRGLDVRMELGIPAD